jgi:serine/threonine protein phosphatase PrpC
VNGQLSVSRAIGDQRFKKNTQMSAVNQAVSCAPDVNICKRQRGDEFLVVACDGIWDVLSSQAVVDLVRQDLAAIRRGHIKPADVISKILDRCVSPDPSKTFGKGCDNMTMILVVFDQTESCFGPREAFSAEKPSPKHRAAVHPSKESNLVKTSNDKDSSKISRRAERKGSFAGRLVARVARTFKNSKL